MKSRQKVRRVTDHRIFRKTSKSTHPLNIPGKIMQRGGTRL